MGIKLVDLLRWSKEVTLKSADGNPIVENEKPVKVYLRIIGDHDLEESYKAARAASGRRRATLRDKTTDDYLSTIVPFEDATKDQCRGIIVATRRRDFNNEGYANVVRPDLPKIEDIAEEPDAPTLEEQEKFDQMILDINLEYVKAIDAYADEREAELVSEIENMTLEEARVQAIAAAIDFQAIQVFAEEIEIQKAHRAVYLDKYFKERGFETVEEFRQTNSLIKQQLIAEYALLELNPDDVKN